MQGGGHGGRGDDHNNGSDALSPNNDDDGVEEEEAAVNVVKDKGEDFATGLTLIRQDNAATMMDAPPPLLARCPLPLWGSPLQRDDRTAGVKNAAASANTAAKVGIIARATASSGAATNAMDIVAWRQSLNNIDYDNEDIINFDDGLLLVLLGQQRLGTAIVGGIKSP
jgi:hypothetical protein